MKVVPMVWLQKADLTAFPCMICTGSVINEVRLQKSLPHETVTSVRERPIRVRRSPSECVAGEVVFTSQISKSSV